MEIFNANQSFLTEPLGDVNPFPLDQIWPDRTGQFEPVSFAGPSLLLEELPVQLFAGDHMFAGQSQEAIAPEPLQPPSPALADPLFGKSSVVNQEAIASLGRPGNGLKAEYFDNADFTNRVLTRIDPKIDFDWGADSPDPIISNDTFSARLTGKLQPDFTEVYTFSIRSDDAVGLWLDGEPVIDNTSDPGATISGPIALEAGKLHGLIFEYAHTSGDAGVELWWSSPSQPPQVIPLSAFSTPETRPESPDVREPSPLQFITNPFYNPGDTLRFRGKVLTSDRDLDEVDFWLQKDGGDWVNISDGTEFVPDRNDPGYAFFNYELPDLEPGRYQLRGTAIASEETSFNVTQSFTVLDLPEETALSDSALQAIARAANLDNYAPEDLARTKQWTVNLRPGASSGELAAVVGARDLGATGHIAHNYIWEFPADLDAVEVQMLLSELAAVQFFYPQVPVKLEPLFTPKDPLFDRQWHLQNTGKTGGKPGVDANVINAWKSATGNGVVIGIVDDGLQHTHPDLSENYNADLSRDFNEGDLETKNYDGDPLPFSEGLTWEANLETPLAIDGDIPPILVDLDGVLDNLKLTLNSDHPAPEELSVYLLQISSETSETEYELIPGGADYEYILDGELPNDELSFGKWKLIIEDDSGETGVLDAWQLTLDVWYSHGTAVAGVAGARGNNNLGVTGVAPDAELAGLRLIAAEQVNPVQIADALYSELNQEIDIYSNSWKPPAFWSAPEALDALEDGVTAGRDGLGNIYVFGAGNNARFLENVNFNPLASSRYTVAVGALDHKGKKSGYSQEGASLLVSAPSSNKKVGITTTDLMGGEGRNVNGLGSFGLNYPDLDYTNDFGGTSSATPVVSGVVALMLEVNPTLTWRDVQHILVETANRDLINDRRAKWTGSPSDAIGHNYKYGFGVVDAEAAVNAAASWTPVPAEVSIPTVVLDVDRLIPDGDGNGVTDAITIESDITVESVEVVFDADHELRSDLKIELTSPSGTTSLLAFPWDEFSDAGYDSWMLTSVRHWGESSLGEWQLRVVDEDSDFSDEAGTWNFWELKIHGTKPTVSIEATGPDASEDGDTGELTFTRTGNTDNPLTVNYSESGTATAGADYEALTETVVIPAGEDSVTVSIIPIDDDEVEGDETVFVVIDADDAYDIGTESSATVNIADNDEEPLRHIVTNTNDSGVGSLRDAIAWANENPGRDTIEFDISGNGPHTISPTSALPDITEAVVIDGWSQNGGTPPATPLIELSGSNAGDSSNGLRITGSNVEVRGLVINNWQRNGIEITGEGATDNWIYGNFIGTNTEGTAAIGNARNGVDVRGDSNIIGTNGDGVGDATEGNLISGNEQNGVFIVDASSNIVAGNHIGTNKDGTGAIANLLDGVDVRGDNNIIGTNGDGIADAIEGNLISGNESNGVSIMDASFNIVAGNSIGTNKDGTGAIANLWDGVDVRGNNNIIGTNGDGIADSAEGNLISGNENNGVSIIIVDASDNIVAGNSIGTNRDGTGAIANLWDGVDVRGNNNIIGTNGDGIADSAEGNLISGNENNGVSIRDASFNIVAGNRIGTNLDGTGAIANILDGVEVVGGDNNIIGTNGDGIADSAEGNLISGNEQNGVSIVDASDNIVAGNSIGTNRDGTGAIGNLGDGVDVRGNNNIIGTNGDGIADEVEGNLISGNERNGVRIANVSDNIVAGNSIGTNKQGTEAIGNSLFGVSVTGDNNIIGTNGDGTADADEGNLISGNEGTSGLYIFADSNIIAGNHIGTNLEGTEALANSSWGVWIGGGANNIIGTNGDGTADAAEGNLISGNSSTGVVIYTDFNIVAGNRIGTNIHGTGAIANGEDGVSGGGKNNRIGGTNTGEGNIIAFNNRYGVWVGGSIQGNAIFANAGLGINLGNDAVTANDLGDVDTGVNNLQNFPELTSATSDTATTTIQGTLNSTANSTFTLEFFANSTLDDSGYGEGEIFLGSQDVTTDSDGNASFTADFSTTVAIGQFITATATDPDGNTSEFSQGVEVALPNVVTNTDDSGVGSLRDAIAWANDNPGRDTILFDIPGDGPHTIAPASALPDIAEAVVIDGWSQNGGTPPATPLIELSGSNAGYSSGLRISGSNVEVRGLVINNWQSAGIDIVESKYNWIYGNLIGTTVDGQTAAGNEYGIRLFNFNNTSNNIIGTNGDGIADAVEGNLISGNTLQGIIFFSHSNVVAGNRIGTNLDGTAAIANGEDGIFLFRGDNNIIGTNGDGIADADEANLISGNSRDGVRISSPTQFHTIAGNRIGTNLEGTSAIGNGENGVQVFASLNNIIGTDGDGLADAAEGNLISGNSKNGVSILGNSNIVAGNSIGSNREGTAAIANGEHGVEIYDTALSHLNIVGGSKVEEGNIIAFNGGDGIVGGGHIQENSIFSNAGLGIDLGDDGVTINDLGDSGSTPQNFPELTSATSDTATTTISGTLNSTGNTTFTLQFFANSTLDDSGYGEGETFLGSHEVTTGSDGNASFTADFSTSVAVGQFITATATDPDGNTSEFSQGQPVENSNTLLPDLGIFKLGYPTSVVPGDTLVYHMLVINDGQTTATDIEVRDSLPDNFTVVNVTPGGDFTSEGTADANNVVTFTGGSLDSGESVFLKIVGTVPQNATGNIESVAIVDPDNTINESDESNNTATVTTTVFLPDLSIFKVDNPDPIVPGETLVYTLVVRNNGQTTATDIQVRDSLPDNFTITNVTPGGDFTSNGTADANNVVTFTGGSLDSGDSVFLTIMGTVSQSATGNIESVAIVDPDNTINESDESNNTATVITDIQSQPPEPFPHSQKILAQDAASDSYFGRSLALDGDTLIVGSNGSKDNGDFSGAAYLMNISTGQQTKKLIAPDAFMHDNFGWSVAVDGDHALVGAFGSNDKGESSGSAYLFDATNGNYIREFIASDGSNLDNFGFSVAIDGNHALIGSRWDSDLGTYSGSAYLFDVTTGQQLRKFIAPDGASRDEFGWSLALHGNYALIGSRRDDDKGEDSGSAYLFDITTGSQLHKFTASDGASEDFFGYSVALNGETALIGAYGDDDKGAYTGAAYQFDVATGQQLRKITAPDGESWDWFGKVVAIDDNSNLAVISSKLDDDKGNSSGAAYLFDLDSGALQKKIVASDGTEGDRLGESVAISGNAVVIGTIDKNDFGNNSGAVYLYSQTEPIAEFNNPTPPDPSADHEPVEPYPLSPKIIALDGETNELFGNAVALEGNKALIGAHKDDDKGTNSGSAYLMDLNTGEQLHKFIAPDANSYKHFGYSVAMEGNYALMGSYGDTDNGENSGAAYLFDTNTGQQLRKFIAPDGASLDQFGWSVALDGNYALIGSKWDEDKGPHSGSAYLFDITTGEQLRKFIAPDGVTDAQFGWSVAIAGDNALIGAVWDDDQGEKSGSAYLFDITTGNLKKKYIAPDGAADETFGNAVALNGNYALIGSRGDSDNGVWSGSAYLFDISTGTQLRKFLAPDGDIRDNFGHSVALNGNHVAIGASRDNDNGENSGSTYLFDITTGDLVKKIVPEDGEIEDNFGNSVALNDNSVLIGAYLDDVRGSDSGSAYLFPIE